MNDASREKIFHALNKQLPNFISDYLSDHEQEIKLAKRKNEQPLIILHLVNALKAWANPDGNFPILLSPSQKTNFLKLTELIERPQISLHLDPLTVDEECSLVALLRSKLDQLADELIKKHHLENELEAMKRFDITVAENWWYNKSSEDRLRIEGTFNKLSTSQELFLQQLPPLTRQNHFACSSLALLKMCNNQAKIDTLNPSYVKQDQLQKEPKKTGNRFLGFLKSVGKFSLGILASPIIGLTYAFDKCIHSARNIMKGEKLARSIYRIGGIILGQYLGATKGAVAGAAIGTVISPGFGTVVGGILGTIIGSGLGAGISAYFCKRSSQLLSTLFHRDAINPSNPGKYTLSSLQKEVLVQNGFNLTVIDHMMRAIKRAKAHASGHEVTRWNLLLNRVKNGELKEPIQIGSLVYDPWAKPTEPVKVPTTTATLFPALGHELGKNDQKIYPDILSPAPTLPLPPASWLSSTPAPAVVHEKVISSPRP